MTLGKLSSHIICRVNRLWRQLTQPAPSVRAIHRDQARLLSSLLVLSLPVGIFATAVRIWQSPVPWISFIVGCITLGSLTVAYILSRTRYYYLGTWLTIGGISLTILTAAVINPAAELTLVFLSISSLAAILFLSTRQAIAITLANIIGAVLVSVLVPGRSFYAAANELAFLVIISMLLAVVIWLRHLSFTQVESQSRKLMIAERQRAELIMERERMMILQQFMGDMSHDFRTPLSTINTSLYMLRKSPDPDKREHYLKVLEEQSRRLNELLDQLRTMSRLDDKEDFEFEPIAINDLVNSIGENMRPAVEKKHLNITFDLAENLPTMSLDGGEISRVLINLIENAIQYTPEQGLVTIRTQVQDSRVVIEVEDTGIGIGDADLPHVFERLYRTDKARSANTGGIGLGLSIVKKIVEAHGGQVDAESTLGEGCTFRVSLPISNSHTPSMQ